MRRVFVTGMLRSGTSLVQILLTNHPEIFVAYQPFHQLHVDIKNIFIDEYGLSKKLPLGDDLDGGETESRLFNQWLKNRIFNESEISQLVECATKGKGGGAVDWEVKAAIRSGSFIEIFEQLLELLAVKYGISQHSYLGTKEVLCEEYIPYLVEAKVHCLVIVRDPRAVIASACHGRYRDMVGDRYPLLMLIRMWRKSAAYWLAYHDHAYAKALRYEDLAEAPDLWLHEITSWFGVSHFPSDLLSRPLRDNAGQSWHGNSSFGDKNGVELTITEEWQSLLTKEEVRFIEACTFPEMSALGYTFSAEPQRQDIQDFQEVTDNVRSAYLSWYRLDPENRMLELKRWDVAFQRDRKAMKKSNLFLFPNALFGQSDSFQNTRK